MDRMDLLGESGAVYKIEHGGKVWKMARMTGVLKAEWEMFLRKRWLRLLKEEREALSEAAYDARMEDYRRKVEEGFFAFESDHSQKVRTSQEGGAFLMRLAFQRHHPDMTDDEFLDLLLDRIDEVQTGFQVVHASDIRRAEGLKKKAPS